MLRNSVKALLPTALVQTAPRVAREPIDPVDISPKAYAARAEATEAPNPLPMSTDPPEDSDECDNIELKVCYAHPQVRQYLRLLGVTTEWTPTSSGARSDGSSPTYQSPLGYARSGGFSAPTLRVVKRAYYSKAMLVHPDAGLSGNSERFVEITDAYKALLSEHSGLITRQPPVGYDSPAPEAYPRANGARPRGLWDVPQPAHCPRYEQYCAHRAINRMAIFAGAVTGLALTACLAWSNQRWTEEHRGKRRATNDEWEKAFFARQGCPVPQLVRSSTFHPNKSFPAAAVTSTGA